MPSYHNLYSPNDHGDDMEDDIVKPWTLHAFLRHYYIPFLKKTVVKVSILDSYFDFNWEKAFNF